ncbi:hypothetical protein DYB28_012480 [Aphanomyces astaci]|uniref:SUEL-type lectin domain-containing protein n=1 Tax=Aphanomyces astaci TaxID=112090 RepID=A0A9X8DTV8_APHAT|nr:hypothetical protein DYB28_012480 [Aphanomyces astaci]
MRVLLVLAAVGCPALSLFSQARVTCISVTRVSRVVWVANVVVQGTLPANICRSSKVYRDDCDVIDTESGCITAQFKYTPAINNTLTCVQLQAAAPDSPAALTAAGFCVTAGANDPVSVH